MKFNSKSGHELRTWILFFVGIALVIIFALKETPLNPWWTLVIGAFTCTAVIVSAVQSVVGGISDVAKKSSSKPKQDDVEEGESSFKIPDADFMGGLDACFIFGLYGCYSATI